MWNGDDSHKIDSTSCSVVSERAADLLWIGSAALFSRIGVALVRALQIPLIWQARASERAALASLDDHLLKDIGLTRADGAVSLMRTSLQTARRRGYQAAS